MLGVSKHLPQEAVRCRTDLREFEIPIDLVLVSQGAEGAVIIRLAGTSLAALFAAIRLSVHWFSVLLACPVVLCHPLAETPTLLAFLLTGRWLSLWWSALRRSVWEAVHICLRRPLATVTS